MISATLSWPFVTLWLKNPMIIKGCFSLTQSKNWPRKLQIMLMPSNFYWPWKHFYAEKILTYIACNFMRCQDGSLCCQNRHLWENPLSRYEWILHRGVHKMPTFYQLWKVPLVYNSTHWSNVVASINISKSTWLWMCAVFPQVEYLLFGRHFSLHSRLFNVTILLLYYKLPERCSFWPRLLITMTQRGKKLPRSLMFQFPLIF